MADYVGLALDLGQIIISFLNAHSEAKEVLGDLFVTVRSMNHLIEERKQEFSNSSIQVDVFKTLNSINNVLQTHKPQPTKGIY